MKFDNPDFDLLRRLLALPTPSGWEADGQKLLADHLRPFAESVEFDRHGNLVATLNSAAPVRVMLEGHCDEIGFMVQYIDTDGRLYMTALGGVTNALLAGERIVIQGRSGPVNGVFGVRPPHLMKTAERDQVAPKEITDVSVDIGASSREEAEEAVELGAPAVIDAGWRPLCGDRVSCRGFDNRIGAFIVAETMRRLAGEPLDVAVHMVSSVQEELGLVGGTTAAYDLHPDLGLCCDVGFASDTPGNDKHLVGDVKLGGGPIVCFGPTYDRALRERLEEVAKANDIPVQRQVRNRGNNTNAWAMRLQRGGCPCALVSVPLRYMHSPVEVISLSDAAKSIELLAATLKSLPLVK
jgi:putative aminopeptidase FrvX